jgi:hypothetical protein
MGLNQIDKIAHYVQVLQENAQERELLFAGQARIALNYSTANHDFISG